MVFFASTDLFNWSLKNIGGKWSLSIYPCLFIACIVGGSIYSSMSSKNIHIYTQSTQFEPHCKVHCLCRRRLVLGGKHSRNELDNSVTLFPVSSHGHKSDAAILSM